MLPPALREIARARRAHPDLNLSELARTLELSKSAVNHRLRRLMEIAEAPTNGEHPHTPAESNGRSS
jgi:DNA-binding protein WhiA